MNITEYESKQLLTSGEYETLLTALNELAICKEVVQINYYFDDKNFRLCEKGDTLRVRQKSGKLSLGKKI
jgi:uncharacterized protein YjbK